MSGERTWFRFPSIEGKLARLRRITLSNNALIIVKTTYYMNTRKGCMRKVELKAFTTNQHWFPLHITTATTITKKIPSPGVPTDLLHGFPVRAPRSPSGTNHSRFPNKYHSSLKAQQYGTAVVSYDRADSLFAFSIVLALISLSTSE